MKPVTIEGRRIARSWWGEEWCRSIEGFADWSDRLPRGRSCCRGGHILDLDLDHYGSVRALVEGSASVPYRVAVQIKPLGKMDYLALVRRCSGRLDSITELLEGRFPRDLGDMFIGTLFPGRNEIRYSCSCPDRASLCRHTASVLYGIGNRLDADPCLIFSLRGIDPDRFLGRIVKREADTLWSRASGTRSGGRIIPDNELPGLFGVDVDEDQESLPMVMAEGSALRLDRQTFLYSDGSYSASAFMRDGRFILSPGARVSAVTKRTCPEHIAASRSDAGMEGKGIRTLRTTVMLDTIEDVTAFIRGTPSDTSPWRTVFGASFSSVMEDQAYLDEHDPS